MTNPQIAIEPKPILSMQTYFIGPSAFGARVFFHRLVERGAIVYRKSIAFGVLSQVKYICERREMPDKIGLKLEVEIRFWRFYFGYFDFAWK